MFKIGEFSRLNQVSVRMLRYYDENGLLPPARVDPATGYRLYSAGQIPRLNRILFLRDVGFGVAEMAPLLDGWNEAQVARRLAEKRADIESDITAQREKLAKIEAALAGDGPGASRLDYAVTIKAVPACRVLSCRRTLPDYYAEGALWKELAAFAGAGRIGLTGETFSIYHDPDYREQEVDVELCALLGAGEHAKVCHSANEMPNRAAGANGRDAGGFAFRTTEAVPRMACTMVYGPFERIAGAFQSFAGWLAGHPAHRMGLTSRQIVHRGPWNEEDPEKYLTELQIPLREEATSAGGDGTA